MSLFRTNNKNATSAMEVPTTPATAPAAHQIRSPIARAAAGVNAPASAMGNDAPGKLPALGAAMIPAASHTADNARRLVVGMGITVNGQVSSCDALIVEGIMQAKLTGARRVEVARTGIFKGSAEIEEACIAGWFDGDLAVKGVLRIRATGMVKGTVRYGRLEVEQGGRISGSMSSLEESAGTPSLARVA